MLVPMPSPRGTNHAGLFLDHRVELFSVDHPSQPMAAYDSKHGLTKGATDMRSAAARDDIPRRPIPEGGPDLDDTELWEKMCTFLKQKLSSQDWKYFIAMVKEHPPQEGATKNKDDEEGITDNVKGVPVKVDRMAADSAVNVLTGEEGFRQRFPRASHPRQL